LHVFVNNCVYISGEQSLNATAARRNKDHNPPTDRARTRHKVDVIIEYRELSWLPVVGCGEVAGGLPRCSRAKEWTDTLKLGRELRDIWCRSQKELLIDNATDLVVWGFTVVGKKSVCAFCVKSQVLIRKN
jgi:hypothetical protein